MSDIKSIRIRVEDPAEVEAAQRIAQARFAEQMKHTASILPEIRKDGEAALRRLMPVAQGDTGQSGVIARFLLGLYNGKRFPFNLNDIRRLDRELMEDCLLVLRMDSSPEKEVHRYFENGGELFEKMASDWASENND